ncbi:DUF983 domain-containing protein [Flavobacteriaceae bacterium]|nr:DUF983 domain-containing protein [Flavobacteriaceae bacterium]MDC1060624.1 DUF983 domain-containing protein [Flavobacteriaceae bacterium]
MSSISSKLKSILPIKCPRCHQGKFLQRKVYDFSGFTSVRKKCPVCALNYHMEPSFYFGSMYVAYGLGVAVMITLIIFDHLFFNSFSFLRTFWSILIVLIVLAPYLNALSKIIWANLFFKYDPKWKEKYAKKP